MASRITRLVFVTGLAGSGKTLASRVLEDLGFYALDNLPTPLIPKFVELLEQSKEEIPRAALVVDLRDSTFTSDFPRILSEVRAQGHRASVLFLEASDEVLLRRFSETRRAHPLSAEEGTTSRAVARERRELAAIRELADRIVDTSSMTIHSLGECVVDWMNVVEERSTALSVTLLTFGFKHGVPRDADWVLDVRFLPNPFFIPALREKSGLDPEVQEYVGASPAASRFVPRVCDMLRDVLPVYAAEGRAHVTVAIGCTGGRHRSVAVSRMIGRTMARDGFRITNMDRDIDQT